MQTLNIYGPDAPTAFPWINEVFGKQVQNGLIVVAQEAEEAAATSICAWPFFYNVS